MMNILELQDRIFATPLNGVCDLGNDTVVAPEHSQVVIPYGMRIENVTVMVNGTSVPDKSFFNADLIPTNSRLEFHRVRFSGPDCSGWSPQTENNKAAISWNYYKTWDGTLIINECEISGGYGTGVLRAGGGRFEVKKSKLSGFVDGIAFFESHGGWGDLILRDTELNAPANSKYSSIGMYIHPHLHLNAERVTGNGWKRYLIYLNGTPQSAGHHTLTECEATDCSLIQTGSSSVTTLIRCVERGTPSNGGSYLKGPVMAVDSHWEGTGMTGMLASNVVNRTFFRNTFNKASYAIGASSNVTGTLDFIDCEVQGGRLMTLTQLSTVTATVNTTRFTGTGTGFVINCEGGVVNVINSQLPPNVRAAINGKINYI